MFLVPRADGLADLTLHDLVSHQSANILRQGPLLIKIRQAPFTVQAVGFSESIRRAGLLTGTTRATPIIFWPTVRLKRCIGYDAAKSKEGSVLF